MLPTPASQGGTMSSTRFLVMRLPTMAKIWRRWAAFEHGRERSTGSRDGMQWAAIFTDPDSDGH